MKKLAIVDASGILYRSYYALPPMYNANKQPVNAVYGFAKFLYELHLKKDIDYIIIAFDTSRISFRQEIYDLYKANRDSAPDDLIPQFDILKDLVDSFGYFKAAKENFEADDIIATYTKEAVKQNIAVDIFSSDKDLMQLICDEDHVRMITNNATITEKEVLEKFGVFPKYVKHVLALMGDAADNVPGVKGVGIKTAQKLMQEYKTLDVLYENIENIKQKKLKEKLQIDKNAAFMSLKLVELEENIAFVNDELLISDFLHAIKDPMKVYDFFNKHDFKSLNQKLVSRYELNLSNNDNNKSSNLANNIVPNKYNIEHINEASNIIDDILTSEFIAFSIDSLANKLFIYGNNSKYEFICNLTKVKLEEVFIFLKDILENNAKKFIFFNMAELMPLLQNINIKLHSYDDLFLMNYLVYGYASEANSIDVFFNELGYSKEAQASSILQAYFILKQDLIKNKLLYLYEKVDKPLLQTIFKMQKNGIHIDSNELNVLKNTFQNDLLNIEKQIYALAKEEFNLSSPKQIGEILFEKMNIKGKKNKSGSWKTDAAFLDTLDQEENPIVKLILKRRHLFKLLSTYILPLLEKSQHDGKIHTTLLQCSTNTGRLSSKDPNLQNIPIRSALGKDIRKAFVAPRGYKILSLDYSQIELRILAIMGNVTNLKQYFINGEDIHSKTASEVFKVPLSEVSNTMRQRAKAINFGIIYGQSEYGLASMLNITNMEAKTYIDSYFIQYPEIKEYMNKTVDFAKQNGFVSTLWGRKCFVPNIRNKNYFIRSFAQRSAINAPIQGTEADMVRFSMNKVDEFIKQYDDVSLLLQVHDELLLQVPDAIIKDVASILADLMKNIFNFEIPIEVNYSYGNSWFEAHG